MRAEAASIDELDDAFFGGTLASETRAGDRASDEPQEFEIMAGMCSGAATSPEKNVRSR